MSGRNPVHAEARRRSSCNNLFLGGGGTLIKNKSSFNLFVNGHSSYETPNINVALPAARTRSEALWRCRSPRDNLSTSSRSVDYALTLDQTLRFGFNINRNNNRNLGIGVFDEEERAYSTESNNGNVRVQHIGPLGRRAFTRTRAAVLRGPIPIAFGARSRRRFASTTRSRAAARRWPAASTRARSRSAPISTTCAASTRSAPASCSTPARWRSDDTSNYLGTYTFESLDAFDAGTPAQLHAAHRRPEHQLPEPAGRALRPGRHPRAAQPDAERRRALRGADARATTTTTSRRASASRGRRLPAGQTTLRSSWGIFYDWLPTNTYEQTLRVDGFRQRELDIVNPPYPGPRGRRRHRAAGQPLPARRRPAPAAHQPRSASASISACSGVPGKRDLRLHARLRAGAG